MDLKIKVRSQFAMLILVNFIIVPGIPALTLTPDAGIRQNLKNYLNVQLLSDSLWTVETGDKLVNYIDRSLAMEKIRQAKAALVKEYQDQMKKIIKTYKDFGNAFEGRPLKRQGSTMLGRKNDYNPNQKILWCGPGDDAPNCETLGTLAKTDRCCRTHDHCPGSLQYYVPHKYRLERNLFNSYPENVIGFLDDSVELSAISLCECDELLYNCLQNVASTSSTADRKMAESIGKIYFNHFKTPCLEYDVKRKKYYAVDTKKQFLIENPNGQSSERNSTLENNNNDCPPPKRCKKNAPVGSCCVPLRGEYRELASRSKESMNYKYNDEDIVKSIFDPNDFLRTSVCNHPMKNHCDIPAGACGAWVKTHEGEPKEFISFDKPFPVNNSKTSNKC